MAEECRRCLCRQDHPDTFSRLWTFAGPGGMVGVLNMFVQQSGIPMEEIMARVEAFQPMKDCVARLKETTTSRSTSGSPCRQWAS